MVYRLITTYLKKKTHVSDDKIRNQFLRNSGYTYFVYIALKKRLYWVWKDVRGCQLKTLKIYKFVHYRIKAKVVSQDKPNIRICSIILTSLLV